MLSFDFWGKGVIVKTLKLLYNRLPRMHSFFVKMPQTFNSHCPWVVFAVLQVDS